MRKSISRTKTGRNVVRSQKNGKSVNNKRKEILSGTSERQDGPTVRHNKGSTHTSVQNVINNAYRKKVPKALSRNMVVKHADTDSEENYLTRAPMKPMPNISTNPFQAPTGTGKPKKSNHPIPKIIHQIWFGDPELKPVKWMESFKCLNPEYEYHLWTEENLPPLVNQRIFDQTDSYSQKSDIARYEILKQYGGFYVDCDFVCLKPFDHLYRTLNKKLCVAYESAKNTLLANGLIGCSPNHPLMDILVKAIRRQAVRPDFFKKRVWAATGPKFITDEIKQSGYMEKINLLPYNMFYALRINGRKCLKNSVLDIPDKKLAEIKQHSFAIHLWADNKPENYEAAKNFEYTVFYYNIHKSELQKMEQFNELSDLDRDNLAQRAAHEPTPEPTHEPTPEPAPPTPPAPVRHLGYRAKERNDQVGLQTHVKPEPSEAQKKISKIEAISQSMRETLAKAGYNGTESDDDPSSKFMADNRPPPKNIVRRNRKNEPEPSDQFVPLQRAPTIKQQKQPEPEEESPQEHERQVSIQKAPTVQLKNVPRKQNRLRRPVGTNQQIGKRSTTLVLSEENPLTHKLDMLSNKSKIKETDQPSVAERAIKRRAQTKPKQTPPKPVSGFKSRYVDTEEEVKPKKVTFADTEYDDLIILDVAKNRDLTTEDETEEDYGDDIVSYGN